MSMTRLPFSLKIVLGVLAILVLCGGIWLAKRSWDGQGRDGLYAVFLSNNQVYFGRIAHDGRKTLVLTSIYYIQPKDQNQAGASDISLLKLGNEVHGPEDQMEINRDHVLFIEKLKADSRVAKAIAEYKPTP